MKSMLFGVLICGLASGAFADPVTITAVTVTIGPRTYDAGTVGWHFPVTLNAGDNLVLSQSGDPCHFFGYCFDTSEDGAGSGDTPRICVTANGVVSCFDDVDRILTHGDGDSNLVNEAQPFGPVFIGTDYSVEVGYADTDRSGCLLCVPWALRTPTVLEAHEAIAPWSGYDAGAIRITSTGDTRRVDPVPEPASLILFGSGLIGLVWFLGPCRARILTRRRR